jgi:hypothetical protein
MVSLKYVTQSKLKQWYPWLRGIPKS